MKRVILLAIVALVISSGCGNSNGNLATSSTTQQFATPTPPLQSTPVQQPTRETGDVEIIATRANLRALPNASSDVVRELAKGDQLTLLADGATGTWYNVRDLESGKSGWIHGNSIKIVSASVGKSNNTEDSASQHDAPSKKSDNADSPNSNTYKNRDGDPVPRPRKSATVPDGASAKCRDGSYSFSKHRQGTCSHHDGVEEWLP